METVLLSHLLSGPSWLLLTEEEASVLSHGGSSFSAGSDVLVVWMPFIIKIFAKREFLLVPIF